MAVELWEQLCRDVAVSCRNWLQYDINLHPKRTNMPNLLIRDLPIDLHNWLRAQALANHRSANREAIAVLESMRRAPQASVAPSARIVDPIELARMRARVAKVQRAVAAMPSPNNALSADEILGYDEHGLPT